MKRLMTLAAAAALLAALILVLTGGGAAGARAAVDTSENTWYVCSGDDVYMRSWGSGGAPIVGYLPAKTQFTGRTFGPGTFVQITDGPNRNKYVSTTNACPTSSTGVGPLWLARAEKYIDRAIELDTGDLRPDFYSRVAQAVAAVDGWEDPVAQQYLERALSTEMGSGGFGLPFAWDAFADGTVNPADTAYTVTMVTHIGDAVLAAFDAGALKDPDVIQRIVDRVQAIRPTPRQPDCISYSESTYDNLAGYCTHNVNAAAAVFLIQAGERGFTVDTPRAYRMLMHEVAALKGGQWLYMTGRPNKPNDPDHGAYQLKSVSQILPELTQPMVNGQMARTFPTRSAEAHTVLAQLACADSARWFAEHDASAAGFWSNADRMAYYAMEAADAAVACS